MADISDIETALVSLLTQTVFPQGDSNPSAVLDSAGAAHNVQIYRGWPVPDQLDTDMAAGTVDVSVFPSRVEVNTTRYSLDWQDVVPLPSPTLTLVAGNALHLMLEGGGEILLEGNSGALDLEGTTITVGGTISVPQNVALVVNGIGYSYGVQPNDTLASIAAGLAALINVDTPATSSGPVISIPSAFSIEPRIGVFGTAVQEVARQKRNLIITIWSPTPDLRDSAAKLFDPVLKSTNFLTLPDGTQCRLVYVNSPITDTTQKQDIYRRDLVYSCEYPTTISITVPTVTVEQINLSSGAAPLETIFP